MSADEDIKQALQAGQQAGLFTQAVLAVHQGSRQLVQTVGAPTLSLQTRFDLASLTKITGTLMGVLHLLTTGQLTLATPLPALFPALSGPQWAGVTIDRLLTHTSGLVASVKFYQRRVPSLLAGLAAVPPTTPGRVVYSDLNFMWLGLVIEAVSGEKLGPYLQRTVFAPLGMTATGFDPTAAIPTRVSGRPDDHNASYFKLPVGHAGLFSSAADLLRFGQAWLPEATLADQVVSPRWRQASVARQTPPGLPPRGLGWVLPGNPESFFDAFGPSAFGHTGYTGTSLLVVPERALVVVLLTDRTHCGVDQRFPAFRRTFHDVLARRL